MKNIKDRINTKLFKQEEKVELSEVVELGLVQDVEKLSEAYFRQSGKMESVVQKIEKAQDDLASEFVQLEKSFSELDSTYQQLRRNAKVLGLEVPTEAVNAYKSAIAVLKNDNATYKKYRK